VYVFYLAALCEVIVYIRIIRNFFEVSYLYTSKLQVSFRSLWLD